MIIIQPNPLGAIAPYYISLTEPKANPNQVTQANLYVQIFTLL